MLSKSAARAFFLGGTGLCTIAFLLLTADTVSQLKVRSHDDQLSPEALRGYHMYMANNCMGCHTLMGEGAYYAPELTRVVSRRGEQWIRLFLKDPQAMYPGRRKMVKFDIFDPDVDSNAAQNVSDIIAFFTWVENIEMNGFPPKPDLAPAAQASKGGTAAVGKRPSSFTVCVGCHSLGGSGGTVGPALDGVGKRFTQESLTTWLKSPETVKPGTKMPNLGLSDEAIAELVTFLRKQE